MDSFLVNLDDTMAAIDTLEEIDELLLQLQPTKNEQSSPVEEPNSTINETEDDVHDEDVDGDDVQDAIAAHLASTI